MTSDDIRFLYDPSSRPHIVSYDPVKLAEWQARGGSSMPKGVVFEPLGYSKFSCPNSTFSIDLWYVSPDGCGCATLDTPEEVVKWLKKWVGSEDEDNRESLLAKIPEDLEDKLKALGDDEEICGDSDWGCKWSIRRDIRTVHSDDLDKIFSCPSIRLTWTESGEDFVKVSSYALTYAERGPGPVHIWYYASPSYLVDMLSMILRVADASSLVRSISQLSSSESLGIRGTTYSDNEETGFNISKVHWKIDKSGKTLFE